MAQMCGGLGQINEVNEDIQEMCSLVRAKVETGVGETFTEFTPISFKSQVVAGTNYFIKVRTGTDKYIHVRIFKALPHVNQPASLHSFQKEVSLDSEIVYFDNS